MRLDNLTREQADMCDIIWKIDSADEFFTLIKYWPERKQQMAKTLINIMHQEEDERKIEKMESFPLVEELIENVRNKF